MVTAYQDPLGNFFLQQWNIPTGGVPAPVGEALNLGGAIKVFCATGAQQTFEPSQIAIATVDPALGMFVTAVSDANQNLYVDVWTLGNDGTFGTGGQTCVPNIVKGANAGLAIAAGYGQVIIKWKVPRSRNPTLCGNALSQHRRKLRGAVLGYLLDGRHYQDLT